MGFFSNLAKKIVSGISNAVKKVASAVGWLFTDAHKRRALAEIKGFSVERSQSAPNLGSGSGESKIEKRSSSVPNLLTASRSTSVNPVEAVQVWGLGERRGKDQSSAGISPPCTPAPANKRGSSSSRSPSLHDYDCSTGQVVPGSRRSPIVDALPKTPKDVGNYTSGLVYVFCESGVFKASIARKNKVRSGYRSEFSFFCSLDNFGSSHVSAPLKGALESGIEQYKSNKTPLLMCIQSDDNEVNFASSAFLSHKKSFNIKDGDKYKASSWRKEAVVNEWNNKDNESSERRASSLSVSSYSSASFFGETGRSYQDEMLNPSQRSRAPSMVAG